MATFPILSSGAIAQYPTPLKTGQAAQVIRFLDGSDQRYLAQGKMLRSWEIQLDLIERSGNSADGRVFYCSNRGIIRRSHFRIRLRAVMFRIAGWEPRAS